MVASLFAAVVLASCGGDSGGGDDGGGGGDPSELAKYLPDDSFDMSVVDLDGAREQLGLDADADAFAVQPGGDTQFEPGDPEYRLSNIAARGFGPLREALTLFNPNPVLDAFDGTQVSAAAASTADPRGRVTVVRTGQSFDEVSDSLQGEGFSEEDGELTSDDSGQSSQSGVSSVADAGDGVIVLADGDADAADLVADPPGGTPALVDLLEPADEPIAVAGTAGDSCVTAIGGWNDVDGNSTLRLGIDGDADPDAFDPDAIGGLDLGEAEADGAFIEAQFTGSDSDVQVIGSPILPLIEQLAAAELYDCG